VISPSFAGVILAAGSSSRMGRDKALLPYPTANQTFLGAAIESFRPHVELIIVVAGTNADQLKTEVFSRGAFLALNDHPERGQFSSLQCGLQEVLNHGRDAALVTHVDRPPAKAETVRALLAEFRRVSREHKWAVVPEFEGTHGHPIVVGREMMETFLRAPVETTARAVEHEHQHRIAYLAVEDAAVIRNVNTPEEYQQLFSSPHSSQQKA
jgi:molybdenum cofactor cytidylyltransferase